MKDSQHISMLNALATHALREKNYPAFESLVEKGANESMVLACHLMTLEQNKNEAEVEEVVLYATEKKANLDEMATHMLHQDKFGLYKLLIEKGGNKLTALSNIINSSEDPKGTIDKLDTEGLLTLEATDKLGAEGLVELEIADSLVINSATDIVGEGATIDPVMEA